MTALQFISGFFQFFDVICNLINSLQRTPEEKRAQLLSDLNDAFNKAINEKDPSNLSKIINTI